MKDKSQSQEKGFVLKQGYEGQISKSGERICP
jgi:hypothetical protein